MRIVKIGDKEFRIETREDARRALKFLLDNAAKLDLSPHQIVGLMIGLLVMAYTLPTAISTLANTSVSGDPATQALWGLLPLLAVVAVIMWIMPKIRR
ncbi:MAG: hypothetical protein ACK40U_04725 [Fervidobacterium pennivorans]